MFCPVVITVITVNKAFLQPPQPHLLCSLCFMHQLNHIRWLLWISKRPCGKLETAALLFFLSFCLYPWRRGKTACTSSVVWIIPDKLCSLQLQGCVVRKRQGFSVKKETADYFLFAERMWERRLWPWHDRIFSADHTQILDRYRWAVVGCECKWMSA